MPNIEKREITSELKESYLDYAMSVIVSRALPDVRDGLKPVQRRILWAMWDGGISSQAKLRKSAYVVGETMGKYHPHGDMAIYDTLVRLAQDFSLRYPLIQGQGNFGCFTKDTKVMLTDGRNLSFDELVKEYENGKTNYTYTVNSNGLISIAKIQRPRLTIKNAELVEITLDNGEKIKCTPNHRFLLRDGTYKEAQNLNFGESLMPIYQKLSTKQDRLNRDGYRLLYQNKTNDWVPAHHLADNYNLTNKNYSRTAGRVRHHIDFNKLNNNPDNIARLHWGDHWKIHYQQASKQHKNPEYRKKIAAGRKNFWLNPLNIERHSKIMSLRNLKNWRNPEYREKMRRFLSVTNKLYIQNHPEKRLELSERATKTLKRLWQDPKYKAFFHKKIAASNRRRISNNTGRLKFLNICRSVLNQAQVLNEEVYEKGRNELYSYGHATTWKTGIKKYFNGDANLILHELNKNHKVAKIETLNSREDVYDLTIDKTHNFALAAGVFVHNSIDGDNAAAQRYTEVKLSKLAEELLYDIEKETVDWQPNYDGTRQEPKVLPAKLPNLLLNGAMGIAVGMATSIPPHNLSEVVEAILYLIDHPKATADELTSFIQGPDFPTGGIIYDKKAILEAYTNGRGAITTRGAAEVKERSGSKNAYDIVITEIPYQVNKSELIIKIAELVQEKRLEGIRDVRDESDKEGLRIVIELKNDAAPQKILNQLYNHTDLQKDFHLNMIALVDGLQPQVLSLKDVLAAYIKHREEVVRRRAQFDLKKAEERAHILEGLSKALAVIDKIIATIKKSADKEEAHDNLIKNFKLTSIQATAILEMKLQTLAALEQQKIEDELKEKKKLIDELNLLLKSPQKILKVIKDELVELKGKYGDERRTKVVASGLKEFKEEDLIPQEETIITFSQSGYIKRVPPNAFRSQKRGGKGLIGSDVTEEDFLTHLIAAETHDNILFFTDQGRVFQTKVWEIPAANRTAKGKPIHNFLEIPAQEKISAIITYPETRTTTNSKQTNSKRTNTDKGEPAFLVMVTKNGIIKKTALADFENVRRTGIIAIKLKKGDSLNWVKMSFGQDEIIITTANGQSIRFKEKQIRAMGRAASGVRAIRLKKNDQVSSMDIIIGDQKQETKNQKLLVVMANGFGKQTPISQYRIQSRGGSGIKTAKITAKTGQLVAAQIIRGEEEMLAISAKGQIIKTRLADIRVAGRATQGVKIMRLNAGDKVAGITCL